jgi:plastocyanin
VDDTNGFQPKTLTIKLGQGVTWVNKGQNVHSAVTAGAGTAPFDSGGLGPGQSATWTPPASGTYTYKSTTDTVIVINGVCNCNAATYPFTGTIVVGQ